MIITSLLPLAFLLGDDTPMELFKKGSYMMWPIIILSFITLTVVVERLLFIIRENSHREPEVVGRCLRAWRRVTSTAP